VVSRAGTALLAELADRLGLTAALSWRPGRGHIRRHRHDPGAVLRDLAVVLADGGDCLSDLAVLRDQPELFGPVASTATAWRVVERVVKPVTARSTDVLLARSLTFLTLYTSAARMSAGPRRGSIGCAAT
jgi:Transposase DDE domain group 1